MVQFLIIAVALAAGTSPTLGAAPAQPPELTQAMRQAEERQGEGYRGLWRFAASPRSVEDAEVATQQLLVALHADSVGWVSALADEDQPRLRSYLAQVLGPPVDLPPGVPSDVAFVDDVVRALSRVRGGAAGDLAEFVSQQLRRGGAARGDGGAGPAAARAGEPRGKPQAQAEIDAVAIPVIEAYVAKTYGWPKSSYTIDFMREERGRLLYWVGHVDDRDRPPMPGGGKSFVVEFDPVSRQVVDDYGFE